MLKYSGILFSVKLAEVAQMMRKVDVINLAVEVPINRLPKQPSTLCESASPMCTVINLIGHSRLRQAFAGWYNRYYGWSFAGKYCR